MKTHVHSEAEYSHYLADAEQRWYEENQSPSYSFSERAADVSRALVISISDAEDLVCDHGVYIPNGDRDIAIMILELGLTLKQASTLYGSGFRLDHIHYDHVAGPTEDSPF